MNYIIKPVRLYSTRSQKESLQINYGIKRRFYKVYLDFEATDSEINGILFENKLRFIQKDKGLFSQYKTVILTEKI